MATAELTVGQAGTVDLQALVDYEVHKASPIPDGMTFAKPGLLSGTPTTPAAPRSCACSRTLSVTTQRSDG